MNEDAFTKASRVFEESGDLRAAFEVYFDAVKGNKFLDQMTTPDIDLIRSRLILHPSTGEILSVSSMRPRYKELGRDGYYRIAIRPKKFLYHRLVWLLHHGEWPRFIIDHIDRDKQNNHPSNLRQSDHRRNAMNVGPKIQRPRRPRYPASVRNLEKEAEIEALRQSGMTITKIGKSVGLTHQRVSQILNRMSAEKQSPPAVN